MYPALGGLQRRVEAAKHGIGNANSDVNVRTGERLEDKWVGVEQLHFGDAVGFQKLHHFVRRQGVRRRRAPVDAKAVDLG